MRLLVLILSLCGIFGWTTAYAANAPDTGAARGAVALTIYNGDVGVVTEQRSLVLAPGPHHITFDQVAKRLLPQTISIDRPGLEVLAQRFVNNPPSRADLLGRFVGQKVLLFPKQTTDATAGRDAWLLSAGGAAPVVRVDNRIETIDANSPWRIAFPAAVFQLAATPFIAADVKVTDSGHAPLVLSYLTQGLSWRLDYVARLNADSGRLTLTGLASIENHSGIDYNDAHVRLVAGEPHHTASPAPMLMRAATAEAKSSAGYAPAVPAFEYYTYTLPRPYTLRADSSVQVPLIAAAPLQVTREYRIESTASPRRYVRATEEPIHARVLLHGQNTLHRPLPTGTVRIFSDRGKGEGLLWLGEDQLNAVPAGQAFTLEAGRAFDVTAVRTQTDFQRLDDKHQAASWKIELHNAKSKAVVVHVVESLSGDWTIDKESAKHADVDAQHVGWKLKVPAGGSQTLNYRVEWR